MSYELWQMVFGCLHCGLLSSFGLHGMKNWNLRARESRENTSQSPRSSHLPATARDSQLTLQEKLFPPSTKFHRIFHTAKLPPLRIITTDSLQTHKPPPPSACRAESTDR